MRTGITRLAAVITAFGMMVAAGPEDRTALAMPQGRTSGLASGKRPAPKVRNPLLRVNLSKRNFLLSEPVFVTISVVNSGNAPVRVRKLYVPFMDLKLFIRNSAGKAFPLAYTSTMQRDSSRSVTVEPNDSAYVVIDLLPLYAEGEPTRRKLHTETFFPPGSYTVRAAFETGVGTRASTPVSFTVAAPEGGERLSFDLLSKAARLQLAGLMDPAAKALDSIIQFSPASAYHVAAYLQKMYMYEYSRVKADQETACSTALALVATHPESEACISALSYYMIHSDQIGKTRQDIRDAMLVILKKFPDTMLAREAFKALQHLPALDE